MMTSVQVYACRGRHQLRRLALDPRLRHIAGAAGNFLLGLGISAAGLGGHPMPLVLSLLCAVAGNRALLIALGGGFGYWLFWGNGAAQPILWTLLGLGYVLPLGHRPISREVPLLLPSMAAFVTAFSGVVFQQVFGDDTAVGIYLLRVLLALGGAVLFREAEEDPVSRWMCAGILVLGLGQIPLLPFLNPGVVVAAALCALAPFPAVALGGVGLDLAQLTPVPMTGVVCLAYFLRLLPRKPRWLCPLGSGGVYILFAILWRTWKPGILPSLLLGGCLGLLDQSKQQLHHRRGETGLAQVRLEMAAGVLAQSRELLLETALPPVDEEAILSRCAERACGGCPCRKGCKDRDGVMSLPVQLLHRPLLDSRDLPFLCRKSNRLLTELHRCQEQLRSIRGERAHLRDHRAALIQQYGFLSNYLRDLADLLPRKAVLAEPIFLPKVHISACAKESDTGDRCAAFAGTQCRYYVLLVDGMGTGIGAAEAGKTALRMAKQMLSAGFPASYALESLNSLCALRMQGGLVTFDLLELQLDSGRGTMYKWGAAASYRISPAGTEKIGTAGPPPGLSVAQGGESVHRLSLRRGEVLVMLSDGVGGEGALRAMLTAPDLPPGELAERILEQGVEEGGDDATVVTVYLASCP